ncbi:MAG: purine-nucleoside phosphorylase [Lachnospiraceae bacterium]|nr:purine-nucleoside phosphorylase [Lachnospiraceae bacterium]
MNELYNELLSCYEAVESKLPFRPELGLILGSGLGDFASKMDVICTIEYKDIPGFPVSTVSGHVGRFVFGRIGDKNVVCMQGRVHYYEGYPVGKVVMPVRLMKLMGIKALIVTNAAGGINTAFKPGDLMVITDHITSFVPSPLIGENIDELGVRFPDMSQVYDMDYRRQMQSCAEKLNMELKSGVYIQLTGPNYETPAEIRMCRALGADAVGMSTAIEAMTARHAGVKVFGMSLITNYASGISNEPLSHEEVKKVADMAGAGFGSLMEEFIKEMVI